MYQGSEPSVTVMRHHCELSIDVIASDANPYRHCEPRCRVMQ